MSREHKIVMTLLILAVGLGTAFCFRKPTPAGSAALPGLQEEERINQKLADLKTRPLLPGIDLKEPSDLFAQQTRDHLAGELAALKPLRPDSRLGYQTPPIGVLADQGRTDSLRMSSREPARLRDQLRDQNPIHPAKSSQTAATVQYGGESFHIVQPGETLSGIAQKRLGAASRFQEIYDANQDVLSGPNHLRPGMKLKLPLSEPAVPLPSDPPELREAEGVPPPRISLQPETKNPASRSASPKGRTSTGRQGEGAEWTILEEKTDLSRTSPAKQVMPTNAEAGKLTDNRPESSSGRRKLFVPAGRTPFLQRGYVPEDNPFDRTANQYQGSFEDGYR